MRMPLVTAAIMISLSGTLINAQGTRDGLPGSAVVKPTGAASSVEPNAVQTRGEDRKEIETLVARFVKAFNAGDATATAATYTQTAIVVDENALRVEGRDAIRKQYAAFFAQNPGSKIAIRATALSFLGTETALEEGEATITAASGSGEPELSRFTTIYVKTGGQWLQAAVRDERVLNSSPHEQLKKLEWMLGEWMNESDDAIVTATCAWAKGGNFLDREFTIKSEGKPVLTGSQRIGWDPVKQQYKTWIFESDGGHGEGYFTQNGQQWVLKVEGVGRNGKPASATNILTRLGKDRIHWQSVERTLGGMAIPDVDEFVVVRKPPEIGK